MSISEDQAQELEALQAIYPNEITVISQVPGDVRFTVRIKSDDSSSNNTSEDTDESDKEFSVGLEFILPEEYPNEVPSILIFERSATLMLSDEDELLNLLNEEAKQLVGCVMVFNLVTIGIDWLNRRKDEDEERRRQAEELRLKQLEEEENRKFEGTRVTVESFLRWKLAFDEEMATLKKQQLKNAREAIGNKLTGRELFEKDRTLNESDLKFLEEDKDISFDDAGVKVDTALFDENIDDEDFGEDD